MTDTNAYFAKQLYGYDIDEVDSYIKALAHSYQMVYDEYNAVCLSYGELFNEYVTLCTRQWENSLNAAYDPGQAGEWLNRRRRT